MKTKLKGFLTLLLALIVQITFAQEKTVSGTVSDSSGILPGVSVVIKGTTQGTETDFDGKYSIKANTGDVLSFSYVGYKIVERTVGNSSNIVVTMTQDENVLDEIVITGVAGPTNRKKLSVTVNSVSAKELENMPTTSAASALQGKVAGVTVTNFGQPGSGATIQLRGATNLFGGQSPLLLVDGVIVEGGIQDINSDDIASFEIVKGASASALYGSRAGNGVIVITTKKGRIGEGVSVTLKSETGFSQINNRIETSNSHAYDLASDYETALGKFTKYKGVTYPTGYTVGKVGVSGARINSADGYQDNPYGVIRDLQDQFFKTGTNQTLYASLSSSSENTNLFFSAEKNEITGVFVETKGYERDGFRLNADFKINDWLKFNARNNFIKTVNNTPGGALGGTLFSLLVAEADSNFLADNPDGQPYYYIPNLWESTTTNSIYNLWVNEEVTKKSRFLGAYNLNFKFTDWLNLDVNYSMEYSNTKREDYNPYNTFTTLTNDVGFGYSKGDYFAYDELIISQKNQITLNFIKSFNDLTVKGKLSYLGEDYHYEYADGYGSSMIYPDIKSLDNFKNEDTKTSSNQEDQRAKNYFGILGLDYKDRYILDGMYRYDGSSLFGKNNRWNSYFRVSGAYRISQDLEIPGVQELKVHAAYGTAGQRPGYTWQYNRIGLENGALSSNRVKSNSNLKPSETSELEFGLNAQFLERFSFEAVYSQAKTENQFMLVDIAAPLNNGANRQWQNVGTVEFKTVELNLNSKIITTENLNWNLGVRFEKTTNEITKLNVDPITVGPDNGELFRVKEGEEFGTMFGHKFVKNLGQMEKQLPSGKSISDFVVNVDGFVVEESTIGTVDEDPIDLQDENGDRWFGKIGTQTPDFKVGITSQLDYKNFGFYMLWDWKQGGDIYNRQGQWLTRDSRHKMIDQAGKPDSEKKTAAYYRGIYSVNDDTDFWVEDGTYVKLREASLYYTFDSKQLGNIANGFFDSLRIGLTGANLLTFTNYSGWDPEIQLYDADTQNYYSVDYGVYPIPTTYTLSVQLKF